MTGRARVFLPYTSLTGGVAWLEIFAGSLADATLCAKVEKARLVVELAPGLWQIGAWRERQRSLRRA